MQLGALGVDAGVLRILLAAALGLFLGLEREWSQKAAGIRTFALVSLLAAVFTVTGQAMSLLLGGVLVIVQGILLSPLLPLGAVIVGSVAAAAYTADWSEEVEMDLVSPFSLKSVLAFGGVFLLAAAASIVVKAVMTLPGPDRNFAGRVALWSSVVLGGASALAVALHV